MTTIIGFSGMANNGKTTLIEKLCMRLTPQFRVGVIKHDPKSKAVVDTSGKDSDRFYQAGANVALLSPTQSFIRMHENNERDLGEILAIFNQNDKLDYLFVEGFKSIKMKRICVILSEFEKEQVESADIIALGDKNLLGDLKSLGFGAKKVLDLNNIDEIMEWIDG